MGLRDVIFCCFIFLAVREGNMRAEMLWAHFSTKGQSSYFSFSLFWGSSFIITRKILPHLQTETVYRREEVYNNSKQETEFRLPPYHQVRN